MSDILWIMFKSLFLPAYITHYRCRMCKAASVGALQKANFEATVKLVRPHTCGGSPTAVAQMTYYRDEMKAVAFKLIKLIF